MKFFRRMSLTIFFVIISLTLGEAATSLRWRSAYSLGELRAMETHQLERTFDTDTLVEFAAEQYQQALTSLPDTNRMPRNARADGSWKTVKPRSWVSGFFPGILWYLYALTEEEEPWKIAAENWTEKLDRIQYVTTDHDVGFQIYCSYGNGFRFAKNTDYIPVMIRAARSLATRFNPRVGAIKSWDWTDRWQYPVIIDNMMNLELLFWAAKATGDSQLYDLAVQHAKTTQQNHFREDYSTYHVLDYDTKTGEVIAKVTFQGYADSSMWARGQAWAIYGYTMAYRETGEPAFLRQAMGAADLFIKRLPEDVVPYWDFDVPKTADTPKDASSAAIAASAFLELSQFAESQEQHLHYYNAAIRLLNELTKPKYLADEENYQGILLHSTGHFPRNSEVDVHIIYADYYFLEALYRLKQLDEESGGASHL